MDLRELINQAREEGYNAASAEAKVCQDIVIKAISESALSRNVTIKGGVVMRNISGNTRRATQDIDIDFIKYSLSDSAIDVFIEKLNCLQGLSIERIGRIKELKQQDYHGKRISIRITDESGKTIDSKIDIGVHKHIEIEQMEYCFDVAFDDEGASLLINSYAQMFTEKLKPILKLGRFSTRYRDIFDMYYLMSIVDREELKKCIEIYILDEPDMIEDDMDAVVNRFERSVGTDEFLRGAERTDKNWLGIDPMQVMKELATFMKSL